MGRNTREITLRFSQVFTGSRHFLFFLLAVLVFFTCISCKSGEKPIFSGNTQSKNTTQESGNLAKIEKCARIFGPTSAGWYVPNRMQFKSFSNQYNLYPSNIVKKAFPLDDKEFLKMLVDYHLDKVKVEDVKGKLLAVISPHAGIMWSGQGGAYSHALLRKHKFKRVLVLANSHREWFRGAAILDTDCYQTPLGLIEIDRSTCSKLLEEKKPLKEKLIISFRQAFIGEHSLEIQLPFLQRTNGDFLLIPIIIGNLRPNDFEVLASTFKKYIDDDTLIVVSSDFTHYGRDHGYMPFPLDNYTRANIDMLDRKAIDRIIALDFDGFWKYHNKTRVTICGRNPIGVLLKMLNPPAKGELIYYYTSGDLTGGYTSSVSYASIIFYRPK